MEEKIIVTFKCIDKQILDDIEIPLNISINDLVMALNIAYGLEIDVSNIKNCYLKSENPIALLKGDKILADYGVRNGSVIIYS